ncbi:bifunctional diaminohydroxyphosphoribosylaminopyrimidine deaminase/5-amino-6-(5-phosphoribosylamino)uracil reductase RibD [Sphingobacterium sp. SGL-16]|uniref:bifunctional diaminohydroxyphosphoribosylaminopyrimidine deaminase/5-amino-6-(5-phosphoribosylamino)uracil reductase RibD n=1 Tax=Sphingobacterium sp. SGL-16 TaxID=2710883 RepID=UPI0013EB45BB|nr:bifunctional diaminohydroxyphosphoribosylaminopyrimidine deaminase/5-amino-6-(5-phosphoribosylamino)uracil reductase RibD [Sphingobacterium sp. SGL-16]NGM73153.1 bifunctional diaminohydroxyphosphoribosylaminopyrimidine deaminase/5-amino-6-(5-phosphoribosylamino)uracil reductase RibD [Sphingobacterium sp. SGL-16]
MQKEEQYIKRCLELAEMGAGTVSPNPMVGAVIVHDDKIIGEGYTSPYGGPHAEVNAVQNAIALLGEENAKCLFQQSTIYVSLEPCAHFGKTPPCADMLVSLQFQKVVVGCLDPFAKVNGLGIQKLREAGIEVVVGVLEKECQFLNRRFFTRISEFRPYVILKWAETKNGFFAPTEAEQKWISNTPNKQLVHKWRSEEDAILVGKRTALVDNPTLTNRLWKGKSPKRVLIDKNLEVRDDANLFLAQDSDLIIFNAKKTDWNGHLKYIELENFDLYLPQNILYQLYLMDVQSIIIEGGVKTIKLFMEAGLWDEARVIVGDTIWENGIPAPQINESAREKLLVGNNELKIYFKN